VDGVYGDAFLPVAELKIEDKYARPGLRESPLLFCFKEKMNG
jgi:hypothetical protein